MFYIYEPEIIIMFFIHHQATAVYQAKEKLKSIEKARKGIICYTK